MNKTVLSIILGVLILVGGLIFSFERKGTFTQNKDYSYQIESTWELPKILSEISGIEWIDENKIAGIQDEDGILFIYNLKTSKIEKKIEFADKGDYEGLAIHEKNAYALRSDGTIFEILNFMENHPNISKFETFLTASNNVEGLCLDLAHHQLLLAIKDRESGSDDYKGVYSFNLKTKELNKNPFIKLDMKDKLLENSSNNISKRLRPSDIEIHPITGEIYILDAKDPKLLILDKNRKFKKLYALDEDKFNQPEGLTFTPTGRLFISNEAGSNPANILEVILKKN
ncbi:SdiA-regulated [Gillisia sp. Hel1_33_143]|uniref:SdiA-regulated domain-containing protein n=1 Tax=Gillisia sp. Hel1_33_143 TaxID=1336796 RepID=UPI00087A3E8A|nr:SdiA-regulated domain-containing protein [Gillisia sp. Hel1_33_143]SDR77732.1 SdiA-regulated [Gillisia sp. Hel1_33_143]